MAEHTGRDQTRRHGSSSKNWLNSVPPRLRVDLVPCSPQPPNTHHSRLPPVGGEDTLDLLDDLSFANDHPDLPSLVEFEPAKALAANERTAAIPHDRADV